MELSSFRQRMLNGEYDAAKKEQVLNELKYFNSIAPQGLRERLGLKFDKEKIRDLTEKHPVGFVLGLILIFPFLLVAMGLALQFGVIAILIWALFGRNRGTPQYKAYDFSQKVALPALRIYDDKLDLFFRHNREDLVDDPNMSYDNALVEAHLVRPIHNRTRSATYSSCSYDWNNTENTDAFEFMGYKLYHEYTDSDGDTHEDIFFDGVIIKFRTSFTINGSVNIMSTTTKKTLIGEREKNRFKKIKDKDVVVIDTENNEFAENFDTIATYDTEAYKFLTPTMIESLLKLRKEYDICICMKGRVMTVTINDRAYKDAGRYCFDEKKPFSRWQDSEAQLEQKLKEYRGAILSIYELKDILDPDGKFCDTM
ncbi:MAG: DUF3137 domain-containing protein [Lachnospiraceae bacterium]|nr:DUF3137 domain-containing protein [Lachnospiraceae bacterium]